MRTIPLINCFLGFVSLLSWCNFIVRQNFSARCGSHLMDLNYFRCFLSSFAQVCPLSLADSHTRSPFLSLANFPRVSFLLNVVDLISVVHEWLLQFCFHLYTLYTSSTSFLFCASDSSLTGSVRHSRSIDFKRKMQNSNFVSFSALLYQTSTPLKAAPSAFSKYQTKLMHSASDS